MPVKYVAIIKRLRRRNRIATGYVVVESDRYEAGAGSGNALTKLHARLQSMRMTLVCSQPCIMAMADLFRFPGYPMPEMKKPRPMVWA